MPPGMLTVYFLLAIKTDTRLGLSSDKTSSRVWGPSSFFVIRSY